MIRMEAVICGIDPGLGATGYAVLGCRGEEFEVIDAGVFRFDRRLALSAKLVALERDLASCLDEHRPAVVAVEQLYAHHKHPRTAILMGHARGVILLTAATRGIEVTSYAATQVKRFLTGNGRASKSQMQRAIQVTLGLASLPEPADVADALALAMCCAADVRQARSTEVVG